MIMTILVASKTRVKTLQNHDVIRLKRMIMDECRIKRYTECGDGRCHKLSHYRTFFDNEIKPVPTFVMKVRNLQ